MPVSIGNSGGTVTTVETNMKGNAERTIRHDLQIAAGDTLVLDSSFGDIRVRTADRAPQVVAEISLTAYTTAEAEEAIRAFKLTTERTSRGIEVKIVGDGSTYEIDGGTKTAVFHNLTNEGLQALIVPKVWQSDSNRSILNSSKMTSAIDSTT